jgi:hypothetical protein
MTAPSERAAVVRWHRAESKRMHELCLQESANPEGNDELIIAYSQATAFHANAANAIERGEHIRKDEGHE